MHTLMIQLHSDLFVFVQSLLQAPAESHPLGRVPRSARSAPSSPASAVDAPPPPCLPDAAGSSPAAPPA